MSKFSDLPSAIVPLTPAAMNSGKFRKASRSGISQQVVPTSPIRTFAFQDIGLLR
jgi:hypothetical protein